MIMQTTTPLVSCIMPTANREKFIPLAIKYFQRQDYPNKELVVLDDGNKPVKHLLPDDAAIRYEKLNSVALSTGAKRNLACEMSKGEIIVNWDDDDWYAGNWISHQVSVLQSGNFEISGLASIYFYNPVLAKCWKYIYPQNEKPWVAGASMAYYKEFWKRHPYKNVKIGEDNMFVWDSKARVAAHSYIEGVVAMVHAQNTSPKHTNNARWNPVPLAVIDNVLKEDKSVYVSGLL